MMTLTVTLMHVSKPTNHMPAAPLEPLAWGPQPGDAEKGWQDASMGL